MNLNCYGEVRVVDREEGEKFVWFRARDGDELRRFPAEGGDELHKILDEDDREGLDMRPGVENEEGEEKELFTLFPREASAAKAAK